MLSEQKNTVRINPAAADKAFWLNAGKYVARRALTNIMFLSWYDFLKVISFEILQNTFTFLFSVISCLRVCPREIISGAERGKKLIFTRCLHWWTFC